jgi:1,4-dihydroxy-6-naphthoate synthase
MTLTLGFSPCPNDTFIFDALVHGGIDTGGLRFEPVLEDVETLNRWAAEGRLDVTKLSFSALLAQTAQYALLHSGAALGRGVGPLLVSKEPLDMSTLKDRRIAIPGKATTANLLLTLAYPDARQKDEVIFSEIEEAVLSGRYDAGLLIHEGRFTYARKGLTKLLDLGDWWESTAQAPIPLGGIVIRRSLGREVYEKVDHLLRQSVQLAWERYPHLGAFVTENAQEMDPQVMRQHIELYVNDFTTNLGTEGERAVGVLAQKAFEAGLVPDAIPQVFF